MEPYRDPYQKHKQKKKLKENTSDYTDDDSTNPDFFKNNPKDEKLHMKTLRTFFFLHAIVSFLFLKLLFSGINM
jgi:hypothetical protein